MADDFGNVGCGFVHERIITGLSSWTVNRKNVLGNLAFVLLGGALAGAQTRPLQTEEATTAPAHTLVLEIGQDYLHAEPNYQTGGLRERLDGPTLRFVYSPADAVEFDLEWVSRVQAFDDPGRGHIADWGDVSLRAKVRFVDGGQARTTIGARFGVTLPETTYLSSLGPNTLRMSAQMLLSQPLGSGFILHANAGLALQDEIFRPHEQRDFLHFGLAAEARLAPAAAVVAEIAGLVGRGAPGVDEHQEARLGVRLGQGRLRWDAALRRGLAKADGTWGATAGLTWAIRRPPSP